MRQQNEMRDIAYLPAVLLRHFTFTTEPTGQHAQLVSEANEAGEDYPIVGFGYSKEGDELTLECLTTIDVADSAIASLLEESRGSVPNIRVRQTGRTVTTARPAKGGDSLSCANHPSTGTLGCLVTNQHNEELILSCNHVIADPNHAVKGCDVVWQPGSQDHGTTSDEIGLLADFNSIQFGTIAGNDIDAAVCEPHSGADAEAGIRNLGRLTGIVRDPEFDIIVRKEGWATGVTSGTLQIKNLSVMVTYDHGKNAIFDGQMGIFGTQVGAVFSKCGDSGSVVIDDQNNAIGLLFAAASGIDLTYVNPIEAVLDYFDLDIVG